MWKMLPSDVYALSNTSPTDFSYLRSYVRYKRELDNGNIDINEPKDINLAEILENNKKWTND